MDLTRVAIVGAGPAGAIADVALQYAGVGAEEIAVFDPNPDPLSAWRMETRAVSQVSMRSESEGHLFATDFPGLAMIDALRLRSPWPLMLSAVNRYHPALGTVLSHAEALADTFGTTRRIRAYRVTSVRREEGPEAHFALYDAEGDLRAHARHVLLAPGHGPWRWPAPLGSPERRDQLRDRVYHSYQEKPYGDGTTVVVGSGMAAAGEWVNILRAGGRVVALHRTETLRRQPLSAPRCSFGGPWLDRFHTLSPDERVAVIADLSRGSAPRPRAWKRVLADAERHGTIEHCVGDLLDVRPRAGGIEVSFGAADQQHDLPAEMLIAATGFMSGWEQYEVVRDLVSRYDLATHSGRLVLSDDCTVPSLTSAGSALAVSGPLAVWAYPAADSLACMKYAARRFAQHVTGGSAFGLRRLPAWVSMVRGGWPDSPAGSRSVPCATR